MANIKVKRSSVPGKVPLVGDLALGEFAVNTHDGKVYTKKNVGGTETIVTINPDGTALENLQNRYSYVVSGSAQTTFAANYVVPYVDVYQNGSRLASGDYTATDGTSVVLAVAAEPGDVVEIVGLTSYTANSDFLNVPGGIATADYLQFDTTASNTPNPGKVYFDPDDQAKTLAYEMTTGITQHVGFEQFYRVKLSAAATKGQVLMFTGTLGASGGLRAAPATGLLPEQSNYILGVALESGDTNAWIFVSSFGEVKDLNTTGGAESWQQGDVLYYNPLVAGGLTKIKPQTPAAIAVVAAVVHVGSSNGILFVRPTFGSVLGGTDGNVSFSSPINGQAVVYETSSGLWKNAFIDYNSLLNKPTLVTQSDISAAVAALVDSAPTTLDTLNELASALGDDPNFATTVTNSLAGKLSLSGGTMTGAITLSGGTANGVAYLNGSKVLTSGSALTFDGSTFSLSGGGITSIDSAGNARSKFEVFTNGQANNQITLGQGFASPTDNVGYLYNRANAAFVFGVNNSEQMRLTSTGLGIGTSSPGEKLTVVGAGVTYISLKGETTTLYQVAGNASCGFFNNAAVPLTFGTNNAERMRLDSSGNLGLGVTPRSGWNSGFKALEFSGGYGAIAGQSAGASIFSLSWGAYATGAGTWAYSTTGDTTNLFTMNSGLFKWFTAPSGTAGDSISFTQAATLSGTSTPALRVGVTADYGGFNFQGKNQVGFSVHNSAGSGTAAYFSAASNVTLTGAGDSAVIGGVDGILFGVNATERARIDSSGNLLVGTTSDNPINSQVNGWAIRGSAGDVLAAASGTPVLQISRLGNDGTVAQFYRQTTPVGNIGVNGSSTSYNTSSDYRLKEAVQPMRGALAKVAALKPVTYKWKADGSDGEGFIAHELAEVVPQCVTGEKDAVDADGKPVYQSIDTSFLVATLTAAIQEQQAIITALTARVAALESN